MEDRLREKVKEVIDALVDADRIHVLAHADADGVSSAAIAARMLMKLEVPFDIRILDIDDKLLAETLRSWDRGDLRLLLDLTSNPPAFSEMERTVIIDHHPFRKRPKGVLMNPREVGKNVSTAVMVYYVARRIDPGAYRYAYLPLIGSWADGTLDEEELIIKKIVEEAIERGVIRKESGWLVFDESRPLSEIIASIVPSDSNFYRNESLVREELKKLNVSAESLKALSEKDKIRIQEHFGIRNETVYRIVGEKGMMGSVHSFATLLNACVKSGRPDVALALALGDRSFYGQAYNIYVHYRSTIGRLLRDRSKRIEYKNLLVFFLDEKDHRKASTIASLLSRKYKNKTVVVLGPNGDKYKVSVRGRNVGYAVHRAASLVGGIGGGHEHAAGATIPKESVETFLDTLAGLLSRGGSRRDRSLLIFTDSSLR